MRQAFLKELFYVLTGSLIIFSGLELIHSGLVLAYININWVLIFWLIIGIVIILINSQADERKF